VLEVLPGAPPCRDVEERSGVLPVARQDSVLRADVMDFRRRSRKERRGPMQPQVRVDAVRGAAASEYLELEQSAAAEFRGLRSATRTRQADVQARSPPAGPGASVHRSIRPGAAGAVLKESDQASATERAWRGSASRGSTPVLQAPRAGCPREAGARERWVAKGRTPPQVPKLSPVEAWSRRVKVVLRAVPEPPPAHAAPREAEGRVKRECRWRQDHHSAGQRPLKPHCLLEQLVHRRRSSVCGVPQPRRHRASWNGFSCQGRPTRAAGRATHSA